MSNTTLPTILITGASKGIGRAIAITLAKNVPCKLALLSRNLSALQETARLCKKANGQIKTLCIKCDITDKSQVELSINKLETVNNFGPLCSIINNAGLLYKHEINPNIDFNQVKNSMDINVMGAIYLCTFGIPIIKKNKLKYPNLTCSVINIGSTASTLRGSSTRLGIYMASKFAIRGFTTSLFKELRDFGIKTSCILPGFVNTGMVTETTHPGSSASDVRDKMLVPLDIANAVQFVLMSSDRCCPLEILLYPQDDVMKYLSGKKSKL